MHTIFYLTEASKEDKIAYYKLMEDNWEKERKKTHTQIAVKAFILMIFMICAMLVDPFCREVLHYELATPERIIAYGTSLTLGFLFITTTISMAIGRHQHPPIELVGWWNYAKEQYGIVPDWEKH